MSDIFGSDNLNNRDDSNARDDGRPRIIFATFRASGSGPYEQSRPILSDVGYSVFSASSSSTWFLMVFFIWVFQFQLSPSKELITQIAGSSVELAALAIAVLALLLQLNKADRWFKLGLLLVAFLFTSVVVSGFYIALTWQEAFGASQQVTVAVVGLLGISAVLQIDWKAMKGFLRTTGIPYFSRYLRRRRKRTSTVSAVPDSPEPDIDGLTDENAPPDTISLAASLGRVKGSLRIRVGIQFTLPVGLVWLPGLSTVTTILVLFLGSMLSLMILMLVTTISVLRSKQTAGKEIETQREDPFIGTLRTRYEEDIRVLIRIGELKAGIENALISLQREEIRLARRDNPGVARLGNIPALITWAELKQHLRGTGVKDDEQLLERALDALKREARVFCDGYRNSIWLVPTEAEISTCVTALQTLQLIFADPCQEHNVKRDRPCMNEIDVTTLANWLAKECSFPLPVVREYMLPRVLKVLLDETHYVHHEVQLSTHPVHLFVSRMLALSYDDWESYIEPVLSDLNSSRRDLSELSERVVARLLKSVPHINSATVGSYHWAPIAYALAGEDIWGRSALGWIFATSRLYGSLSRYKPGRNWTDPTTGVTYSEHTGYAERNDMSGNLSRLTSSSPYRQRTNHDIGYFIGKGYLPGTGRTVEVNKLLFVIEVRSKGDYGPAAEEAFADRRAEYFRNGVLVVWDIDLVRSDTIRAYIFRLPEYAIISRRSDNASGKPALWNWVFPVDDLFPFEGPN
ncbi:MAG TPA: hypothetical protein VJ183_20145 [Chloroflexia bacterium]|nr:hypothetical protein [Chloroflexia bacterium]